MMAAAFSFAHDRSIGAAIQCHHDQRLAGGLHLFEQLALIGRQIERGLVSAGEALQVDLHLLAFEVEVSPTAATTTSAFAAAAAKSFSACSEMRFQNNPGLRDWKRAVVGDANGISASFLQGNDLEARKIGRRARAGCHQHLAVERQLASRAADAEAIRARCRWRQGTRPRDPARRIA